MSKTFKSALLQWQCKFSCLLGINSYFPKERERERERARWTKGDEVSAAFRCTKKLQLKHNFMAFYSFVCIGGGGGRLASLDQSGRGVCEKGAFTRASTVYYCKCTFMAWS